jgi:hypothetical protein
MDGGVSKFAKDAAISTKKRKINCVDIGILYFAKKVDICFAFPFLLFNKENAPAAKIKV